MIDAHVAGLPPPPLSEADTGLPMSFVADLVLKVVYFNGTMLGHDIAEQVCLPFALLERPLKFLANEGYCACAGIRKAVPQAEEPIGAGMEYAITSMGRQRARELLDINQYAGPAPVPISEYCTVAAHQAECEITVNRASLREAFAHLVLGGRLFDHLGPAIAARHACFLYGPSGNGKTSIADASARLMGPPIFVPRALHAHGEVIRFFDPAYHTPTNADLPAHDRRWQLAQRPAVKVGGELNPRMLELAFDPTLGFYEAPLQLKANGGLLLIDDFGRQQQMSPRELLNRLIVPLENRVDYVNIARAGASIGVPFTSLLMLSTNLDPDDLVDEAFLRRVRYKVQVPDPTLEEYVEIWRRTCAARGIAISDKVIMGLIQRQYVRKGRHFRGSHARDLVDHVVHLCRYLEVPPQVTPTLLDMACETYFVDPRPGWTRIPRVRTGGALRGGGLAGVG